MKLSLALASTLGLLVSQGQGVTGSAPILAGVLVDGDGCGDLECGKACYGLTTSATTELTKISKGRGGDMAKVEPGGFWNIGVCNQGGKCVPNVKNAAATCEDPVNEATTLIVSRFLRSGLPEDEDDGSPGATGFYRRPITSAIVKRVVEAYGGILCPGSPEEIIDAIQEALRGLLLTVYVSPLGGWRVHI